MTINWIRQLYILYILYSDLSSANNVFCLLKFRKVYLFIFHESLQLKYMNIGIQVNYYIHYCVVHSFVSVYDHFVLK